LLCIYLKDQIQFFKGSFFQNTGGSLVLLSRRSHVFKQFLTYFLCFFFFKFCRFPCREYRRNQHNQRGQALEEETAPRAVEDQEEEAGDG